jgi:hypothetical protein
LGTLIQINVLLKGREIYIIPLALHMDISSLMPHDNNHYNNNTGVGGI